MHCSAQVTRTVLSPTHSELDQEASVTWLLALQPNLPTAAENWLWSPGAPPLLPVPIITPLLPHSRPDIEALDSEDLGSVLARLPF